MAADHRQAGSLWTPEEDVVLLRHVAKYGTKHWGYLQTSGVLPHRDQKACCNRFILLKRKFFQARARGQRLSFPVVPQPEVTSSMRRATSPTASGLGVSRNSAVSFKKQAQSGPPTVGIYDSSALSLPTPKSSARAALSEVERLSTREENPVERPASQRAAHSVVSASAIPQQHNPRLVQAPTAAPPWPRPVLKAEAHSTDDLMPPLVDMPLTSLCAPLIPATVEPSAFRPIVSQSAPGQPRPVLASATRRCFNPVPGGVVSADQLLDDVALLSEAAVRGSVIGTPVASPRNLSPDALLDQIAAAPMQMLFGHRSLPPNASTGAALAPANPAEVLSHGDIAGGGLWDSPVAAMDLWDLMRNAASV